MNGGCTRRSQPGRHGTRQVGDKADRLRGKQATREAGKVGRQVTKQVGNVPAAKFCPVVYQFPCAVENP